MLGGRRPQAYYISLPGSQPICSFVAGFVRRKGVDVYWRYLDTSQLTCFDKAQASDGSQADAYHVFDRGYSLSGKPRGTIGKSGASFAAILPNGCVLQCSAALDETSGTIVAGSVRAALNAMRDAVARLS